MSRVLRMSLGGAVCAVLGYQAVTAAGFTAAAGPTVITVTAGKPSEYAFTLSRSSLLPSTVTFKVTNKGALTHQFEVCTSPAGSATQNSCFGSATRPLTSGQSATLTVTFRQQGTYEFLSKTAGQAARGMKGLIGIGVSLTPTTTTGKTTTPSTTPATTGAGTTTAATTTSSTGSATSGAALFDSLGCSSCHSAAGAHAAGAMTPGINSTHTGGPFTKGPLTADQIAALTAFINAS